MNRLLLEQQHKHRRLPADKTLPKRVKVHCRDAGGRVMPRFVIVNALERQQCREAAPAPPLRTVETFDKRKRRYDFRTSKTEQDEAEEREKRAGSGEGFRRGPGGAANSGRKKDPKLLSAEELENKSPRHRFHLYQYHIEKMERLLGTPMLSELLVDYVDRWRPTIGQQGFRRSRFHLVGKYTNVPNGLPVATLLIWTGPLCTGTLFCLPITCHLPQWHPPRSRKVPPLYRLSLPTAHYLVR
jgi:hypothetical protein